MNDLTDHASLADMIAGNAKRPFPNKAVAERNREAAMAANPKLLDDDLLQSRAERIVNENASMKARAGRMLKLVSEVSDALLPHTACRTGCNHCCHIAVEIFEHEAQRIAEYSGRVMTKLPFTPLEERNAPAMRNKYHGVACPFLVEGRCSVYEVRPFACREHHSLDDTPAQCDLSIPSKESSVPSWAGVRMLELPYAWLMVSNKQPVGDIRDFFPS